MANFDKVIGYRSIISELEKICDVLVNKDVYSNLGVNAPKGVLLHGEPGVGKTLMAKQFIEASGRKAFVCRKDEPNGEFVKVIKKTFEDAKADAPSIIFLDDMDKFANGDEHHPDAEEYVTVQACIDEICDNEVFVIATANNIKALPQSLLRVGRFDRVIFVPNPTGKDARDIIEYYIKQKKFVGDIDIVAISRIMSGHSCAELETIINDAGLYAGYDRSDLITMEHFTKAALHLIFGVPTYALERAKGYDLNTCSRIVKQTIYHEAGHITVAEMLDPGCVTLSSAYSKRHRSGGFTSYSNSDEYKCIANEKTSATISLAGMAATEQKLGIYDEGSSSDLNHAFSVISSAVKENCTISFSLFHSGWNISEALKSKQEEAISTEVERCYRKAKEILSVNSDFFEAVAKELACKGVVTTEDIKAIKEAHPIVPVAI